MKNYENYYKKYDNKKKYYDEKKINNDKIKKKNDENKEVLGKSVGTSFTNVATTLFSSFTFLSQFPQMSYRFLSRSQVQATSYSKKEETAQIFSASIIESKSKSSSTPWKDFAGHTEIKPLLQKEK